MKSCAIVLNQTLKDMGGGLDGELYVSDAAYLIGDKDLHMTVRLLNGDSENHLPVIYISRCFDGSLPLNVAALSRSLGGLAHVLVEPSRSFSRLLQQETMSRNAYGGAIGIYLPTGARSLVFPDHFNEQEVRFRIVDTVQEALLGRRPLAQCTWYSLEAEKSRQEITRLRLQNSTDIDAFSQAFDTENSALRSELSAANAEILRMKIELNRSMQHQRDRFDVSSKIGIQEYFNGECEHFIFDALEAAISNVQEKSRRQEVLRQYLKNFSKSNELERRKGVLKSTLKDASGLDSDVAKSLENLGFSIDSSGKHHKIVYNGDESLTFTMSKTSSDWRSGLNLASDISKKIY